MQREILYGDQPPGERLIGRELAGRFQVSAIPVRTALRELENRGLVRSRFNHGSMVIRLPDEEVSHASRLRRALEPQVAEWAGGRFSGTDKREVREALARLESAAAKNGLPGFFCQDIAFHRAPWLASGNPCAIRALESALSPLLACGLMLVKDAASFALRLEAHKHRQLAEGLCAGDAAGAARILRKTAAHSERPAPAIVHSRPQPAHLAVHSKDIHHDIP